MHQNFLHTKVAISMPRGATLVYNKAFFGANRATQVLDGAILVQKYVASRSWTRLDFFSSFRMSLFLLSSLRQRAIHLGRKKRETKPINASMYFPCVTHARVTLMPYAAIFNTMQSNFEP
jgi:hypothetical protein